MFNKNKIALFCIIFLGLFLRLFGNNWDQGWHLHPDERFLTMVGVDVKIPLTLPTYLDQHVSPFNPVNKGHAFFVYGTFPLLLNKLLAPILYNDSYDMFHLQGRILSGAADFLIILIIYQIVGLVEKKYKLHSFIKYGAAFFYAIAVLPIQLSHFFAADTFLNLFCWTSLYFAMKFVTCSYNTKHVTHNIPKCPMLHVTCYMCLSGLFLGLALACKVSAVYFAPLVGIFVLFGLSHVIPVNLPAGRQGRGIQPKIFNFKKVIFLWIPAFAGMTAFLIFIYLALRLGSPYYFETGNVFNLQMSKVFLNNIQTLKSFDNPAGLFPPANQWVHASPFLSIINVICFGVGPVYFIFSLLGFIVLWRQKKWGGIHLVLCWVVGFTVYQSIQFAKTMRYLLFIYPFLAIFAAVGLSFIIKKINLIAKPLCYLLYATCYIVLIIWPLAFMSIYTKDHSRTTASKWMYDTLPRDSVILTEYWDDPLPLAVQNPVTKNFSGIEVHIFDPDTQEKWIQINSQLQKGDYYSMSSNRGWGSIPTTPERYPVASEFYKKMFQGKAGYKIEKQFSSYPSLRYLGIPLDFPDQWAEEAFTVYDHPLVTIFKKI